MLIPELNTYAVIEQNGKYLLLKRRNGIWEFPGGSIEKGESPERACEREAYEESGLNVRAGRMICTTSAIFEGKCALYAVYECRKIGGKLKISEEHEDCRWASKKEMKELKMGFNVQPVLQYI